MEGFRRTDKINGISRIYLLKRWLLDFAYPNRCPFCDKIISFDEYHCSGCGSFFAPPPQQEAPELLDGFTAFTSYDIVSRAFVSKIKNENNGYAISAAAYMIYKRIKEEGAVDYDYITYVPMRKRDIFKRGYNQTKILAKELSGLLGLKFVTLLKKNKDTLEQKKLSAKERKENVKGVFSAASKGLDLTGRRILILDDVCTTGSTLSECAKALRSAGADYVAAAVFAKTQLK